MQKIAQPTYSQFYKMANHIKETIDYVQYNDQRDYVQHFQNIRKCWFQRIENEFNHLHDKESINKTISLLKQRLDNIENAYRQIDREVDGARILEDVEMPTLDEDGDIICPFCRQKSEHLHNPHWLCDSCCKEHYS